MDPPLPSNASRPKLSPRIKINISPLGNNLFALVIVAFVIHLLVFSCSLLLGARLCSASASAPPLSLVIVIRRDEYWTCIRISNILRSRSRDRASFLRVSFIYRSAINLFADLFVLSLCERGSTRPEITRSQHVIVGWNLRVYCIQFGYLTRHLASLLTTISLVTRLLYFNYSLWTFCFAGDANGVGKWNPPKSNRDVRVLFSSCFQIVPDFYSLRSDIYSIDMPCPFDHSSHGYTRISGYLFYENIFQCQFFPSL